MDKRSFLGGFKRVSTATLALAMAASFPGVGVAPSNVVNAASVPNKPAITQKDIQFKDLPRTHWAHSNVQWGVGKGLVVGYQDGTYKPSLQITEEEFVTVLSRYTNQEAKKTEYWSQGYYDALAKYALPLKGNSDKVAKKTGLSRGNIARIIAAKNGFNLDERQAIYYMYENDISNGLIDGTMSYESYGKDNAVTRAQIPAFFQRLEEKGHTTFKGKPSPVKDGSGIGGILGVPKDEGLVTDDMFKELEEDRKGPVKGDFSKYDTVAKKHGLRLDGGSRAFELRDDKASQYPIKVTYSDRSGDGHFTIRIRDYTSDKHIMVDLLKQTGNFNDSDIKELFNIIENKHTINYTADQYSVSKIIGVDVEGRLVPDGVHGLTLNFSFIK